MKAGDFVEVNFSPSDDYILGGYDQKSIKALLEEIDAAKLVEKGDVYSTISVVVVEEGRKVVKLIKLLNEFLPKIVEPASQFWEDLVALFSVLPEGIEQEGKRYSLYTRPVKGKGYDEVIYLELDGSTSKFNVLLGTEAKTMFTAKRIMYKRLQDLNYV